MKYASNKPIFTTTNAISFIRIDQIKNKNVPTFNMYIFSGYTLKLVQNAPIRHITVATHFKQLFILETIIHDFPIIVKLHPQHTHNLHQYQIQQKPFHYQNHHP